MRISLLNHVAYIFVLFIVKLPHSIAIVIFYKNFDYEKNIQFNNLFLFIFSSNQLLLQDWKKSFVEGKKRKVICDDNISSNLWWQQNGILSNPWFLAKFRIYSNWKWYIVFFKIWIHCFGLIENTFFEAHVYVESRRNFFITQLIHPNSYMYTKLKYYILQNWISIF